MKIFIHVILLTMLAVGLYAKKNEVDFVALAALLLKDGYYDRANETLNQVDVNQSGVDLIRFYTLKGLVLAQKKFYAESNDNFRLSLKNGQEDKSVYLYMAQNSYQLHKYEETIESINNAGELINTRPKIFGLKADAFWKLKAHDEALKTLSAALHVFPQEWSFYKQRFYYFIELELYQSALQDAGVYMKHAEPNVKTSLTFINALRKSAQTDRAIELCEAANLQFIESAEITVLLAHLYLDKGMIQAAADLFDEASIEDGAYTKEAAEMMRRAGEYTLALFKNSQMLEMQEKYKQRIAIFLEFGDFERIVAMKDEIYRSGLIESEDIRYALAYAYYMIMDYGRCENELKMLSRPDLFSKATELRKNMEKCQVNFWECQQ
jgi:tetratricopeptide (TPR) repeat protein